MDLEHEKYGSIDPKQLIEQDGETVGNVAADEFSPGAVKVFSREGATQIEDHPIIEGLPPIGAKAEHVAREEEARQYAGFSMDVRPVLVPSPEQIAHYDEVGTEAMAAEVYKRAMDLITEIAPAASDEKKKEFGDQASASFKTELIAKNAEKLAAEEARRKEEQEAADSKVQILIDRLKAGEPLSVVLTNSGATKFDNGGEEVPISDEEKEKRHQIDLEIIRQINKDRQSGCTREKLFNVLQPSYDPEMDSTINASISRLLESKRIIEKDGLLLSQSI
jgi:hypothetical protein